jgi:Ca2+-transporting ATPase
VVRLNPLTRQRASFLPPFNSLAFPQPQQTTVLLESSPDGLSTSEAQQRLHTYGANELKEGATRSPLEILWDQFKNIMLLMLIAVALVSLVLDLQQGGFPKDAIAIFAIVILNGMLGYLQESKAEKALAALKNMTSPRVRVIRDGQEQEVDAKALVPGDIILLEAGVQVPADGRLLNAANLQIREAALTGEAEAVPSKPTAPCRKTPPWGIASTWCFRAPKCCRAGAPCWSPAPAWRPNWAASPP